MSQILAGNHTEIRHAPCQFAIRDTFRRALSGVFTDAIPGSFQKVYKHVSMRLEIVPTTLRYTNLCIDGRVARPLGETLVFNVRHMLLILPKQFRPSKINHVEHLVSVVVFQPAHFEA
jgi:hypothetical protein